MRKLTALVAAVTAAATLASGCVAPFGCGAPANPDGVEGEWAITVMRDYASPCATPLEGELAIYIDAAGEVTQVSDAGELVAYRVWVDGDRQLVELTRRTSWLDPGAVGGVVTEELTYQLELVPVTQRLEGTVSGRYDLPRTDSTVECSTSGLASGGFLAPPA